jgi:hypothetical protein
MWFVQGAEGLKSTEEWIQQKQTLHVRFLVGEGGEVRLRVQVES